MTQPRGIRNNNPGNIRHGQNWQGLAKDQKDSAFCTFSEAKYGIRALAVLLRNYQTKYGLKSVFGIINRFAPSSENNTKAYITAVCKALGVYENQTINVFEEETMLGLIKAIIRHENGIQPYADSEILKGIRL